MVREYFVMSLEDDLLLKKALYIMLTYYKTHDIIQPDWY
jgi:hypothetical protein